jgi:hypothetical protein
VSAIHLLLEPLAYDDIAVNDLAPFSMWHSQVAVTTPHGSVRNVKVHQVKSNRGDKVTYLAN